MQRIVFVSTFCMPDLALTPFNYVVSTSLSSRKNSCFSPIFLCLTMSILLFHWIRFFGAIAALLLAILYLAEFEQFALAGFLLIGIYVTYVFIRMRKGGYPARCDLCGSRSRLTVEHEGFSNVRLILECPRCGRVVNTAGNGIIPGREKDI